MSASTCLSFLFSSTAPSSVLTDRGPHPKPSIPYHPRSSCWSSYYTRRRDWTARHLSPFTTRTRHDTAPHFVLSPLQQWAKNAPSSNWRYERRRSPSPPRRGYGGGSRGGDYRDSRDYGSRGGDSRRGGPPPAEHHRGGERDRSRSRSRSPVRGGGGGDASSSRRDRSPSPRRQASPPPLRGEDREDERDHRVHDDDDLSAAAPHSAAEESRYRDNEDADAPAANGAQD